MRRSGFTLVELLVVLVVVILVSAVALPVVLPALRNRQVGEAARVIQAALAGARDSAIQHNSPRGIRLLPDRTLSDFAATGPRPGGRLASNRVVPIEPAPDLTDSSDHGSATFVDRVHASWSSGSPPPFPSGGPYPCPLPSPMPPPVLVVAQSVFRDNLIPPAPGQPVFNLPTNWFWNVRLGDRFQANDSGRYYTVVGPMTVPNPENFVNDGAPDAVPTLNVVYGGAGNPTVLNPEFLFLVNGTDDNGDGFADSGFDGVDNSTPPQPPAPPGIPAPNGLVDDLWEWVYDRSQDATGLLPPPEVEAWLGSQAQADAAAQNNFKPEPFRWTIARRPVPSPGAREVNLPSDAVIDLTTWDLPGSARERSRLPVDPFSGTVDVLLNQAGQVVSTTLYSTPSSASMAGSFCHFWVADRSDVTDTGGRSTYPRLPVSTDVAGAAPAGAPTVFLKRDRTMVTLFARTGQTVTTSIEAFDYGDSDLPYRDAQLGTREAR